MKTRITEKIAEAWLAKNRPHLALWETGGIKGYYSRSAGPAYSFHYCGRTWRDVLTQFDDFTQGD